MSKGSKRRDREISRREFSENWEYAFGAKHLTPEERAQIQKDLLEIGHYEEGPYRTDH